MRLTFFILFFSGTLFAQHEAQPMKESAEDLRSSVEIFSIQEEKSERIVWLLRTAGLDYFLRLKNGDEEKLQKIDSKSAKKLEMDFASRFLKTQYEIEGVPGDCKVTLRLSMKGEAQEICKKDDKKTQEFTPFLQELIKRF